MTPTPCAPAPIWQIVSFSILLVVAILGAVWAWAHTTWNKRQEGRSLFIALVLGAMASVLVAFIGFFALGALVCLFRAKWGTALDALVFAVIFAIPAWVLLRPLTEGRNGETVWQKIKSVYQKRKLINREEMRCATEELNSAWAELKAAWKAALERSKQKRAEKNAARRLG